MFNAHCHLELSHLKGRIRPGLPFVEWLECIVNLKRTVPLDDSRHGARAGLERLLATGTTVLFDILSLETSERPLRIAVKDEEEFRTLLFWELINFLPGSGAWAVERAITRQFFEGPLHERSRHGLSPHAPYTTTPELLRSSAELSAKVGQWLCIHAAETAEETEMFLNGTGALREFLSTVVPPTWKPPAIRPIEYLHQCNCLGPRTLLAHCNDIVDSDVELLVRTGTSVVVCPGTHVYFGRGAFPLERLWRAGVPVYLGTDSLASNDDLDMNREVTIAKELCPQMPKEAVEALVDPKRADRFFAVIE